MQELILGVGQAHKIEHALRRNGWKNAAEVELLAEGNLLGQVYRVVQGQAKIVPVTEDATRVVTVNETTIAVNLSAAPKLPFNRAQVESHTGDGWAIVEKRADGLYVNGRKVVLYLSKRQMSSKQLSGHELREELTGKPVLNANIMDALYDNPHLIPDDWKKEGQDILLIFFWGTIYCDACSILYIRFLYFSGSVGSQCYNWLGDVWNGPRRPATLLAST